MISEGLLQKNTLKLQILQTNLSILYFAKGGFQMDITSRKKNDRF